MRAGAVRRPGNQAKTHTLCSVPQVRQLLDAGVAVGVGVDGSASNDCGSLLAETRLAYLLQRAQGTIEGAPMRPL